jgi:hypothetical protein
MLCGMLSTLSPGTVHTAQSTLSSGAAASVTVTITGGGLAARSIAYYVATNVIGLLFLKKTLEVATAAAARHVQRDFPDAPEAGVSIFAAMLNPAHGESRYVQFGPEYERDSDDS